MRPVVVPLGSCFFLLVVAQALVLPLKHQFAHQLRKQHMIQHQHLHGMIASADKPLLTLDDPSLVKPDENETCSGALTDEMASKPPIEISPQVANHGEKGQFVTVAFEAVPFYPESGGKQHLLTLALNQWYTAEDIAFPRHPYNARIASISNAGAEAAQDIEDEIICTLFVEEDADFLGTQQDIWQPTQSMTFAKADGTVELSGRVKEVLDAGGRTKKLGCSLLDV